MLLLDDRTGRGTRMSAHEMTKMGDFDLRERMDRDVGEVLVGRARWLLAGDRELIEFYFGQGIAAVEIARLQGKPVRSVRRRLKRFATRLASEPFAGVLRQREAWPKRRRNVATAVIVEGKTLGNAAKTLGLTLHQIRREMAVIEHLVGRQ